MPGCPHQLIVLGPPGSGKSTHAARLAERLGAAHVNLGALFRELGKEDAAIAHRLAVDGAQAQPLIDALTGWTDVLHVDGAQPVESVTDQIVAMLRCPS